MKHRYALIVGIHNYNDAAHFIPLPLAQANSQALYELIIDPNVEDGSQKMPSTCREEASRDEIESQLRELCLVRAQQDDLVLLYFAGHAFIDAATQDGYLALRTTHADRPATGLHVPTLVDH